MKNYTIEEIRTTLYPIISEILTPEFNAVYNQNVHKYSVYMAELILAEASETDKLIRAFASSIGSKSENENLIQNTPAQLLICFFARYHLLTSYLANEQQDKIISLPEPKADFFVYLLTNFYLFNFV